jgi:hypothetical protein
MNAPMNPLVMLANAARRLENLFPGYFQPSAKHNHFKDFGWPDTLEFNHLYKMFLRNGIARAGIEKTVGKTWQDFPFLLEVERDGSEKGTKKETPLEKDIRLRFDDLRLWQHLAEADRRSLVGNYAGVILRLADSKRFQEPVDTVPGGLEGLVELIPAWEGQLTVAEWDTDEMSETYGQPKMFQFNEAEVSNKTNDTNKTRSFMIHPDRVLIWSRDGTIHGTSLLEPGYNDLVDLEKIKGSGGEGFWKNAKSAPVLEVDKEAKVAEMAKAMGVEPGKLADAMNDQVEDWQKGFDQLLMVQGMQAKTLGITLPSPEHFWAAPLQSFAASIGIPLKILVGSQTGERASTEDASEWAQTIMSRRASSVVPNIMALVRRLEDFNILPNDKDWFVDWSDLTEASMGEKVDRANKMADTNQKMKDSGEIVFTHEEIRAAVDLEPLSDEEKFRDDDAPEDETAALGLPAPSDAPPNQ